MSADEVFEEMRDFVKDKKTADANLSYFRNSVKIKSKAKQVRLLHKTNKVISKLIEKLEPLRTTNESVIPMIEALNEARKSDDLELLKLTPTNVILKPEKQIPVLDGLGKYNLAYYLLWEKFQNNYFNEEQATLALDKIVNKHSRVYNLISVLRTKFGLVLKYNKELPFRLLWDKLAYLNGKQAFDEMQKNINVEINHQNLSHEALLKQFGYDKWFDLTEALLVLSEVHNKVQPSIMNELVDKSSLEEVTNNGVKLYRVKMKPDNVNQTFKLNF